MTLRSFFINQGSSVEEYLTDSEINGFSSVKKKNLSVRTSISTSARHVVRVKGKAVPRFAIIMR